MKPRLLFLLSTTLLCLLPAASIRADSATEIGFIEKFALAADREKVLNQLAPGSEDFYYFSALHYQNTRQTAKLAALMAQWAAKMPDSHRRTIIENREALLTYEANPKGTLEYLEKHLDLHFDHHQEARDQKPDLPTMLDPAEITPAAFRQLALDDSTDDLSKFSESALVAAVREKMEFTDSQRRALLARLTRPDVPGLVELIGTDLESKESRGFGDFSIHQKLLPEQLDTLAQRLPRLFENEAFVNTRLGQLAPNADIDLQSNPAEHAAWLDRLWAYAKNLAPSFNSLKAGILHRRLEFDRTRGLYDRARFLAYLELPRRTGYMNPAYLSRTVNSNALVNFDNSFGAALGDSEAIRDDEPLLRACLLHFLATEDTWKPYAKYLREEYVKPIFAEAKIVSGAGQADKWASLLSPTVFQALQNRVDLDFAPENPAVFKPADAVTLRLWTKNAPKLLVRIHELNALGFFQSQHRQLNTDIDIDGLTPNVERTQSFDDASGRDPFRRSLRSIDFPELQGKRGAWIIEFIAGGKSSRALVRKGQWEALPEIGPAGDMLTVIDEARQPVKDAVVWADGRRFTPDARTGMITLPFTAQPGSREIVLASASGDFASLVNFYRHDETYRLDAQFYLNREQLLSGKDASLAVWASLDLDGQKIPLSLVEKPRLTVETVSLDGITTTQEITPARGLKLEDGPCYLQTLAITDRIQSITATLAGTVEKLSAGGEKQEISASRSWSINGIDTTAETSSAYLQKDAAGYALDLLGKNGEPRANQAVNLTFTSWQYSTEKEVSLSTDERGRVMLGKLDGISKISLDEPEMEWTLCDFGSTPRKTIQAAAADVIEIPWTGDLSPAAVSLLEKKGEGFVANRYKAISLTGRALSIKGLTPGNYLLSVHHLGDEQDLTLKISGGASVLGWIAGDARLLERSEPKSLQIDNIEQAGDSIVIRLRNADSITRVHIAAARYFPEGDWFLNSQFSTTEPTPREAAPAYRPNLFLSGRAIGDEYRYILERRYSAIYPGNMLTRPGLILNPWELKATELQSQEQEASQAPKRSAGDRAGAAPAPEASDKSVAPSETPKSSNLDFLATAAPVFYNLAPDKDGIVRIDRKALGDRQYVQVCAVGESGAAWNSLALPETPFALRDLRLEQSLDPAKAFYEKREVSALTAGQTFALDAAGGSEWRTYDSLAGVYSFLSRVDPTGAFAKFAFILDWPNLSDEEKRAKYSQFSCHELNFFLAQKDPQFFQTVIRPYLANKKDPTFLDNYLLGADLRRYLAPAAYARLSVAEKALLGKRLPGEAAATARSLSDLLAAAKGNPDDERMAFEWALGASEESTAAASASASAETEGNAPKFGYSMNGYQSFPVTPTTPASFSAPKPETFPVTSSLRSGNLAISQNAINAILGGTSGIAGAGPAAAAVGGIVEGDAAPATPALSDTFSDRSFLGDINIRGNTRTMDKTLRREVQLAGQLRAEIRPFYRRIGPTKVWSETNYFEKETPNDGQRGRYAFWAEYAAWDGQSPFLPKHLDKIWAAGFSEKMLALALLDVPFEAGKSQKRVDSGRLIVTVAGNALAYHKELAPTAPSALPAGSVQLSEHFFRTIEDPGPDEASEKFVTDEFVAGVTYGSDVIVTNASSERIDIDLLLQIPRGALPVNNGKATAGKRLHLDPFATTTEKYYFYFPKAEAAPLPHYPAHASIDGQDVAAAIATTFKTVDHPSATDTASWDYVSQYGSDADVFAFLDKNNLEKIDLELIAWRAGGSAEFLHKLTALLGKRRVYNDVIYSYAVKQNDREALREWLPFQKPLECGPYLESPLLHVDPVDNGSYEHLEFAPLINARSHRLGAENHILNVKEREQYESLMSILAHKPTLDANDQLAVVYFLFLQDRVEEALARFHALDPAQLATRLQYDYFHCYAALYEEHLAEARGVASQYAAYPVERWRKLFTDVLAQLDEIAGATPAVAEGHPDKEARPDREAQQSGLAATESSFDFQIDNHKITLNYKNLGQAVISYYLTDPEFLFSSNPFASANRQQMAIVKPAKSVTQTLPENQDTVELPLPAEYEHANVLVEVVGGAQRKTQTYHANSLKLALVENYGRMELRDSVAGKPVAKAYVKVYARLKNGQVRFYKDGYTDLRGKFDYASLNAGDATSVVPRGGNETPGKTGIDWPMLAPDELGSVERLSLLVLSDAHGALVREVNPPGE